MPEWYPGFESAPDRGDDEVIAALDARFSAPSLSGVSAIEWNGSTKRAGRPRNATPVVKVGPKQIHRPAAPKHDRATCEHAHGTHKNGFDPPRETCRSCGMSRRCGKPWKLIRVAER